MFCAGSSAAASAALSASISAFVRRLRFGASGVSSASVGSDTAGSVSASP